MSPIQSQAFRFAGSPVVLWLGLAWTCLAGLPDAELTGLHLHFEETDTLLVLDTCGTTPEVRAAALSLLRCTVWICRGRAIESPDLYPRDFRVF